VAATSPSVTQKPEASPQVEVAANATPSKDNYYYVLLNDGSESTLQQARTIVPDAYTRDFPQGTRIQMGAFKVEAEAKSLIEQLQQQGISASIYRP
jgi:cell division septation protein DedD